MEVKPDADGISLPTIWGGIKVRASYPFLKSRCQRIVSEAEAHS